MTQIRNNYSATKKKGMTEASRLAATFKFLCLLRFTSLQSECTSQKQDQTEIMRRAPQASPVDT